MQIKTPTRYYLPPVRMPIIRKTRNNSLDEDVEKKERYFSHLFSGNWGQEEKGTTEDEMAGWHHRLDGRESE